MISFTPIAIEDKDVFCGTCMTVTAQSGRNMMIDRVPDEGGDLEPGPETVEIYVCCQCLTTTTARRLRV